MGGEGTETLLNALLISDIGKDLVKYGQLRLVKRRNMKTGLSHQGEKSHSLQRNGFTTGIWSGDNQKLEFFSQTNVDRYSFFLIQKRMTAFFDINNALLVKYRLTSVVRAGKLSAGKDKVQTGQKLQIRLQRLQFSSGTAAQGGQNHFYFFFLTQLQLMQLIIQLQHCHWLDK